MGRTVLGLGLRVRVLQHILLSQKILGYSSPYPKLRSLRLTAKTVIFFSFFLLVLLPLLVLLCSICLQVVKTHACSNNAEYFCLHCLGLPKRSPQTSEESVRSGLETESLRHVDQPITSPRRSQFQGLQLFSFKLLVSLQFRVVGFMTVVPGGSPGTTSCSGLRRLDFGLDFGSWVGGGL